MTVKAQLLRILLVFPKKLDLRNHCHGITPYIKGAFYSSATIDGARYFSHSAEGLPGAVDEITRSQTTEDVFRKWGFDDAQVTNIFQRLPSLQNIVYTKVECKLNSLKELGLSSSELVKIIHCRPRILTCRFNENLDEHLYHLQSLLRSRDILIKAIVKFPSLLVYKRDEVELSFAMYEQMGLDRDELISMLLHRPSLIRVSKMSEEKLECIRRTGVAKESKMCKYVVTTIGVSRIETIHEKVANLVKFGIPEDEVWRLFGRSPVLMCLSEDKVQRNMTFLVAILKLPANTILQHAFLLIYNLENSLKPRALLAGKIQDMGVEPQIKGPMLLRALRMTEKRFLKVFVNCHDKEVSQELSAYFKAAKGIKRLGASSEKHRNPWVF